MHFRLESDEYEGYANTNMLNLELVDNTEPDIITIPTYSEVLTWFRKLGYIGIIEPILLGTELKFKFRIVNSRGEFVFDSQETTSTPFVYEKFEFAEHGLVQKLISLHVTFDYKF